MPGILIVGLVIAASGAGYALGSRALHVPHHRIERGRVVQVARSCEEILIRLNGLDHRFDDLDRRMGEVERSTARAATEMRLAVAQNVVASTDAREADR